MTRPNRAPISSSATATVKTCYSCGWVGHIASNPECPRYNESTLNCPRVATQCVPERRPRWVIGWLAVQARQGPHPLNDDALNAVSPDLGELLDELRDLDEVRVGAMRQYFAMRIQYESDVPLPATPVAPTLTPDGVPALAYLDGLQVNMRPSDGCIEWSVATKAAQRHAGVTLPEYSALCDEFEGHHGPRPYFNLQTLELDALDVIGAEEDAHHAWRRLITKQPSIMAIYTADSLRTTAVDPDLVADLYACNLQALHNSQDQLVTLLDACMNALADIDAQSGQELPTITAELLSRARSDNE
ncbi:hypothetical protein C8J57DRAFT_1530249 [Mycena rebaudengoi]|nr:hypothetical protein C8J57DRAFT_1530249 [Mycena rebaudengoi]